MSVVSNYTISREPNRFGGNHPDFLARSKKTIDGGTAQLQKVITTGGDLKAAFFPLHKFLAKERQDTAAANGTKEAHAFGLMRNSDEAIEKGYGHAYTLLDAAAYIEYGTKKIASLQDILREMLLNPRQFKETKRVITEKTALGRQSTFEIEILSIAEIEKRKWDAPVILSDNKKADKIMKNRNSTPFQRVKALKNAMPELYERHKMADHLNRFHNSYPDEVKTDFVLATASLEINGKLVPISQYLTWMNVGDKKDPMELMTEKSRVAIIHLDETLLDGVLDDVSALFKKAVEWKRPLEIRELKDRVGLFRYEFNNAMPEFRGSEAICEYLENIIYKGIHRLDLEYTEGVSIGLESFRLPLDQFMPVYHSAVKVTEPSTGIKV